MGKAALPVFVGIDVAKHRLEIHVRPSGESFTIGHGEEEVATRRLGALLVTRRRQLLEMLVAERNRRQGGRFPWCDFRRAYPPRGGWPGGKPRDVRPAFEQVRRRREPTDTPPPPRGGRCRSR
jgi:hypothetical protein